MEDTEIKNIYKWSIKFLVEYLEQNSKEELDTLAELMKKLRYDRFTQGHRSIYKNEFVWLKDTIKHMLENEYLVENKNLQLVLEAIDNCIRLEL